MHFLNYYVLKNVLISTCYRPPGHKVKSFKKHIAHIIDKASKEKKKILLVGDFNINSLDYSINYNVKNFIDFMFSKGVIPLVNRPTRVTKNTATCIDHIYTNSYHDQNILSGIIKNDLSDHFPVFLIYENINATTFPDKVNKQIKIINKSTLNKFKRELSQHDWSLVTSSDNPNQGYEVFERQFQKIYHECFPTKTIK